MSRKPAATAAILIIAMLEALMPWREARSESFEHGLLWRLERPGSVPSYVFGTLHSTDARAVALPPPVARAFARARVLAVEVYLSDAEEADFFDAMQFDDGTHLERLLGAPWYAKLQRVLGASAPAGDVLARTKPWAAWLRATAMPAASGVATPDRELLVPARKRRMEVIGLEGLDEQVALFDAIPLDTQIAVLRDALDRRDALQVQVEPTLRAWLDRDLWRLARINQAIGAGDPDLARHYAILSATSSTPAARSWRTGYFYPCVAAACSSRWERCIFRAPRVCSRCCKSRDTASRACIDLLACRRVHAPLRTAIMRPSRSFEFDVNIADLRSEYARAELNESDVDPDPLRQFERWLGEAIRAAVPEPTAMTLATADASGRPSARVVLCKGVSAEGLVFFTNYDSRKGRELALRPEAALLFHWVELERQVRIEGAVVKVSAAESDAYFSSRPPLARIGAWASPQSKAISDRAWLEREFASFQARFPEEGHVPRPAHWGGYRVEPAVVEFWQGRRSRLHDRIRYAREGPRWRIERLAP